MAANDHNIAEAEQHVDLSRTVTYGIINGVFIRKVPITVVVYPEIADQVKQVIQILEYVVV